VQRRSRNHGVALALWSCAALAGCERPTAAPPPPVAPEVEVELPVCRDITDYEDFTGQTDAYRTIDVRARVTGYLSKINFREGAEVEAGAVLFEIDPQLYEAEFTRAEADVAKARARLKRLNRDFRRAETLHADGSKLITEEQYDLVTADLADAEAAVAGTKASLLMATVNLGYTKVTAPIGGRLSRQFIDPGNLVIGDQTMLTRIVTQEPMYVYFDVDERTMLRLRRLMRRGITAEGNEAEVPVQMGLVDEDGYPHDGKINFHDNRMDSSSGTLRVRAVFANAERLLSPGLFARVRIRIGDPKPAVLVPEKALGADQGQKFLFVVGADNKVERRKVKVGKLQEGLPEDVATAARNATEGAAYKTQWRVIAEGLSPDERVVVSGLQRIRDESEVRIKVSPPETAAKPRGTGDGELATGNREQGSMAKRDKTEASPDR